MKLFKTIEEFPSYTISSEGEIINSKGEKLNIGKRKSNSGYIQVRLSKDGKYYYRYIHKLLALAFIENPNNYRTVNHKDGNKLNNVLSNLEWASDEQQQRHAFLMSLKPIGKSFTDEQLYEVYRLFFIERKNPKYISILMDRPFGTIRKICYGERCNDMRKKFLSENTEINLRSKRRRHCNA